MSSPPKIGVTCNWMPPSRERHFYKGKSLEYAESDMLDWVRRHGGMPILLPVLPESSREEEAKRYAELLDGLLLTGGADVSPQSYGEEPRREEWSGQPGRDGSEFALLEAFLARDLPILGVCRGHQVINVYRGGSLHQDLVEDGVVQRRHRDPDRYDLLAHHVRIDADSYLHALFGTTHARVNSVHHQAVRKLGEGLVAVAWSDDGVIEAIHDPDRRYLVGVQWHPEWVTERQEASGVLSGDPLMRSFLEAVAHEQS